jgi:pimeloyl-ACP methyl ester carboxylesterase
MACGRATAAQGAGRDVERGRLCPVNGLSMYYEIHGAGDPVVVLLGAYMTVELVGDLVPALAESRQVIAVEFQGHGHTGARG